MHEAKEGENKDADGNVVNADGGSASDSNKLPSIKKAIGKKVALSKAATLMSKSSKKYYYVCYIRLI